MTGQPTPPSVFPPLEIAGLSKGLLTIGIIVNKALLNPYFLEISGAVAVWCTPLENERAASPENDGFPKRNPFQGNIFR